MVLVRRKRVLFHDVPENLDDHLQSNADVFYIPETGEIFLDYQSYASRMTFYKLNIFMCEATGKSGLDYFQAAESERNEAGLHGRIPEQLKAAVLRAVQWQIVGRLDHLVEAVYDRYKDRYFKGEKVFVDVQGDKYLARIVKVFPPRNLKLPGASSSPLKLKLKLSGTPPLPNGPTNGTSDPNSKPQSKYKPSPSQRVARSYPNISNTPFTNHIPSASSPLSICQDSSTDGNSPMTAANGEMIIHSIGANLKLSLEEANKIDDPASYYYSVQMIGKGEGDGADTPTTSDSSKYAGSEMEVTCAALSRDRLNFNKALLRRFLKDALERNPASASPWTVKKALADKYGIETEMPQDVREGVEGVKREDHEKRRRVWEESPPRKKQKLNENEKANDVQVPPVPEIVPEAPKAPVRKKGPVRYPTEDLDVKLSERDRRAGKILTRPQMDRDLPFDKFFEPFLMTWNFLVTFGKTLHLSSFTLDEYEKALRHSLVDPACQLMAEIHVSLVAMISERPFERHCAILSLMELKDAENELAVKAKEFEKEDDWQVEIDELLAALADVGVSWESNLPALVVSDDREGWEAVLVGVLKDYATVATFPRLRPILTSLVYGPSPPVGDDETETGSVVEPCHPADRYPSLPVEDKIAVIQYLCDLAIACKPIRSALDAAETELTELRKEKIEVNRERKRILEELNHASGTETAPLTKGNVESNAKLEDTSVDGGGNSDADAYSERMVDASSDVASDFGGSSRAASTTRGRGDTSNPTPKSIAHAKERARARGKAAEAKAAQQEHRRQEDTATELECRLEVIERKFRQTLGIGRSRPLGRDRFYNRVWWFDGLGSAGLPGPTSSATYGTGRIFIQGASEADVEMMEGREDYAEIVARRVVEEGEGMVLKPGEWGCFHDPAQMEVYMNWLNVKGQREFQLDRTLKLWWDYVIPGMRKRLSDIANGPRQVETSSSRRSSRGRSEVARESYVMWTNKRKVKTWPPAK
ncbi:hypothetical protein FRB99_003393 [Tulasnella sp. 403]|nr:hypothetical protein FRB99_003393 [Tulasnella sp. 403]